MKSSVLVKGSKTSNIIIDKSITNKYSGLDLFTAKLNWAKDHFRDRDMFKELEELNKKEELTKP